MDSWNLPNHTPDRNSRVFEFAPLVDIGVGFGRLTAYVREQTGRVDGENRFAVQTARFIFQSSEIYGGLNGFWDYGPLGAD